MAIKGTHKPGETYMGHEILEVWTFSYDGTFKSLYAAQAWCTESGYEYGSMCGTTDPIALQKNQYNLPEKWKNISGEDIKEIDGVMISNDFREGGVVIYIFN